MRYDKKCQLCALHEGADSVCLGARGARENVSVLFVSEAPTPPADAKGRAFADREGLTLSDCIKQMGLESYALTYAVKCLPDSKRGPKVAHLTACLPYLAQEIEEMRPAWIVPMGNAALRAITTLYPTTEGAKPKTGITKYAGRVLPIETRDDFAVFPMISARGVDNEEQRTRFVADFTRFTKVYAGEDEKPHYPKLTTAEAITWLDKINYSEAVDYYSIDLETTSINPRFGEILTLAMRACDETVWFEWDTRLRNPLAALLQSEKVMVAHNATFELKWLIHHVMEPNGVRDDEYEWPVGDSLLIHYLLDENSRHGLSGLAKLHTDIGGYDDDMEALKADIGSAAFNAADVETLGQYNAGDADTCFRLYEKFYDELDDDSRLVTLYWRVLNPAIWTVAWSEYNGRRVDPQAVAEVRKALEEEIVAANATVLAHPDIARWAEDHDGEAINLGSPKQLAKLLTEYMDVPLTERTDGGDFTTGEAALLHHTTRFPWITAYLEWKKAGTILNNYLGEYPHEGNPDGSGVLAKVAPDGFLYGSYLLHGTTSGRLASRDPNLQNFKKQLRKIVRSRFAGGTILEADYSQLELRLMAWQSGCAALLNAFMAGEDVHLLTASIILNKPKEEVTKDERKIYGKVPNFGLTYGMGWKRFAFQFQVAPKLAKFIVKGWHSAYPEVSAYIQRQHQIAKRSGMLRSLTGRVRRVPDATIDTTGLDYKSPTAKRQYHALLSASNFGTQALGSDLNTISAGWMRREIARGRMGTKIMGLTHDSGTYDVPPGEEAALRPMLQDCMVTRIQAAYPQIEVPLVIDISVGDSWGDLD